jgi:hypothetical protein
LFFKDDPVHLPQIFIPLVTDPQHEIEMTCPAASKASYGIALQHWFQWFNPPLTLSMTPHHFSLSTTNNLVTAWSMQPIAMSHFSLPISFTIMDLIIYNFLCVK